MDALSQSWTRGSFYLGPVCRCGAFLGWRLVEAAGPIWFCNYFFPLVLLYGTLCIFKLYISPLSWLIIANWWIYVGKVWSAGHALRMGPRKVFARMVCPFSKFAFSTYAKNVKFSSDVTMALDRNIKVHFQVYLHNSNFLYMTFS